MTLFARLLTRTGTSGSLNLLAVPENEYEITGVYVMGNGTTGTVIGELGEALDPLETGGEFEGKLTATTPSGCTAERKFSGAMSAQSINWKGIGAGTSTCSPSPLAFESVSMLVSDSDAPLPEPPPPPSTTTSSTMTTSTPPTTSSIPPLCTFAVSPAIPDPVDPRGAMISFDVFTEADCSWEALSLDDFLKVDNEKKRFGPTGAAPVVVTVARNDSRELRTGELRIAGFSITVSQNAFSGARVVGSVDSYRTPRLLNRVRTGRDK